MNSLFRLPFKDRFSRQPTHSKSEVAERTLTPERPTNTQLPQCAQSSSTQDAPGESELAARISSYELAARMQLSVPEVSDLSQEPDHIKAFYGIDAPGSDSNTKDLRSAYARNCILARRLIEKGVRFVQLFNGAYQTGGEGVSNWDGHKTLEKQYQLHGQVLDQPTAPSSRISSSVDYSSIPVVWCTEFEGCRRFKRVPADATTSKGLQPSAGAGVQAPYSRSHGSIRLSELKKWLPPMIFMPRSFTWLDWITED